MNLGGTASWLTIAHLTDEFFTPSGKVLREVPARLLPRRLLDRLPHCGSKHHKASIEPASSYCHRLDKPMKFCVLNVACTGLFVWRFICIERNEGNFSLKEREYAIEKSSFKNRSDGLRPADGFLPQLRPGTRHKEIPFGQEGSLLNQYHW